MFLKERERERELFLPKANGGLDLPELTTLYKKLHAAKAACFMYSRDPMVRAIVSQLSKCISTFGLPVFPLDVYTNIDPLLLSKTKETFAGLKMNECSFV